jgi:hypothetical protein
MNGHFSSNTVVVKPDKREADDLDDNDDDTSNQVASFAYQRLPDTDSDDDGEAVVHRKQHNDTVDDDDDDDDDDSPGNDDGSSVPAMRVDMAIVLAEARMPAVLPDDAYARFANQSGLISGEHELPPRPLEAELSNDDVADVLAAMSGLQLSYRPAWASAQEDLASVDELVRQRTGVKQ